ncbi:hypothetical protein MAR_024271 [Mya arenaria]|uniref:Uncharacterized protein n=1 Tax=Mya arenaria TaxID=6604 RepID=A0ABY7DUX1_MYAAR|nr:hypothetical protein MAR_024271 [Mya arenaria]
MFGIKAKTTTDEEHNRLNFVTIGSVSHIHMFGIKAKTTTDEEHNRLNFVTIGSVAFLLNDEPVV